jgi:hypothetical protein
MRSILLLSALVASSALAQAPEEDAEHRADRMRTEELNRAAEKASRPRVVRNGASERAYRDARADYERELAAWRKRVADCQAGYWDACR